MTRSACNDAVRARHRPPVARAVWARRSRRANPGNPSEPLATSVISIEEQLTGWYTQLRQSRDLDRIARAYASLSDVIEQAKNIRVLPFPREALDRFVALRKKYPRLGRQDLAIAAIVLHNEATLVTRNRQDFEQIDGLKFEDWSS